MTDTEDPEDRNIDQYFYYLLGVESTSTQAYLFARLLTPEEMDPYNRQKETYCDILAGSIARLKLTAALMGYDPAAVAAKVTNVLTHVMTGPNAEGDGLNPATIQQWEVSPAAAEGLQAEVDRLTARVKTLEAALEEAYELPY